MGSGVLRALGWSQWVRRLPGSDLPRRSVHSLHEIIDHGTAHHRERLVLATECLQRSKLVVPEIVQHSLLRRRRRVLANVGEDSQLIEMEANLREAFTTRDSETGT